MKRLYYYDQSACFKSPYLIISVCCLIQTNPHKVLTPDTQFILMVMNPVVLVSSRGAQIRENYVNKQTGAQSIATVSVLNAKDV